MTSFLFAHSGTANLSGIPTLHLQATLYTIQAQYWDPIKKSNQPLPPHTPSRLPGHRHPAPQTRSFRSAWPSSKPK